MDSEIFLSVVIPAYNEQKKIVHDLQVADAYLSTRTYAYEIIVVDDGSADRTTPIAEEYSRHNPEVRVIRLPLNRGKGAAVCAGMRAARGQYALFADAGTCVPYDNLERGLALLKEGGDMAIGTRAVAEARIRKRQPFYRRAGSKVFQWIVHNVIGLPEISDTQCGFKMFKRSAYRDIFESLVTDGFMFDIETLLYARWRGYSIRAFPVEWSNDPDTRFKPFLGSIRNFKELLRIAWRMQNLRLGRIIIQDP